MKLIAKQDFSWAHRGVQIEEFKKGQDIETEDPDLIKVSTDNGWATKPRKSGSPPPASGDAPPSAGADADLPGDPTGGTDDTNPAASDTDPT